MHLCRQRLRPHFRLLLIVVLVVLCHQLLWSELRTGTVWVSLKSAFRALHNALRGHRYCFKDDESIIFMHLDYGKRQWVALEICAIKSAAVKNPHIGVCVLTAGYMHPHAELEALPNLEIATLDVPGLVKNTPLAEWYKGVNFNNTFLLPPRNYALVYAYLYKYGGKYLPLDSLTLNNFTDLRNAVSWSYDKELKLGREVLCFEKGHRFLKVAMENFRISLLPPGPWNGRKALLDTVKRHVSPLIFEVLEAQAFYPVSDTDSSILFAPSEEKAVSDLTADSFAVNLWRDWNENFWMPGERIPKNSFVANAMRNVCALPLY